MEFDPIRLTVDPISSVMGFFGQQQTNQTNSANMAATNAMTERLSSTAHQREVDDLKAAGLNPMLSYNRSGASTPVMQASQYTSPISSAVHSGLEGRKVHNDSGRLKNETTKTDADVDKTRQELKQLIKESDARLDVLDETIRDLNMSAQLKYKQAEQVDRHLFESKGSWDERLKRYSLANKLTEAQTNSANAGADLSRTETIGHKLDNVNRADEAQYVIDNPKLDRRLNSAGKVVGAVRDGAIGAIAGKKALATAPISNAKDAVKQAQRAKKFRRSADDLVNRGTGLRD